jgi:uncharacterized protein (UPF0303 family)
METTGNFTSTELLEHEHNSAREELTVEIVRAIGEKACLVGMDRKFPITISIELDGEEVFRRALPGASEEHAGWITRKSNVVNLTHHSTMYERVKAEEEDIDWHAQHGVVDETHAIHGGGFPLLTRDGVFRGVLLISGLPQVEDHLFAVEVLQP